MDEALHDELLSMAAEDSRVRAELAADGWLFQGYHPRMQEVHDRNAARLEKIILQFGWPGQSRAGKDGTEAAWLIAQHAIARPRFQRDCLSLLQKAAERTEVPPWQPAYLLDRIRVFEGKLQVYGTQFETDESGMPRPSSIERPEAVNQRRLQVGLDTIEERTVKNARASPGREPVSRP